MKNNKNLLILYITSFILGISTALPTYINSSFIEDMVSVRAVGLFFLGGYLFTFFAMIFFPILIKKVGNFFSTKLVVLLNAISLLMLVIVKTPLPLFFFFSLLFITSQLLWINMDIFVESFTDNANTGKVRTTFFTFMNLGWIFSPTIASLLVRGENDYSLVYIASAIFAGIFYLVILYYKNKISRSIEYNNFTIKHVFSDFWHDHSLRGIYFASFFLNFFYASAVVYIPIYLNKVIGLDWSVLGIMFSIMLVPFVLFEIPAGIIADKRLGEKEMMTIGAFIVFLSFVLFFSVKSNNPFLWGAILFFSRIGAALIEAMRESRFFKLVDVEDVSHINVLRTSHPLGYLVGAGIGALVLSFYSIEFLFLFSAILFLYCFYFIFLIKDSK
ncbi:MAG: MFS transporter [Patescibacteria group bacterium]|jgi:predicted MFS family arabinose efflux permease